MKRIILHMGLPKTATSSIQKSLQKNRELLARNGIQYGYFTNYKGRAMVNHSAAFTNVFSEIPGRGHMAIKHGLDGEREKKRHLKELSTNMQTKLDTIIFSSELIPYISVSGLKRLKEYFQQFDAETVPVCCVRSPYQMSVSSVQERAKIGGPLKIIADKNRNVIEKLKSVFGNDLSFYSFQSAKEHPLGPVGRFNELAGLVMPQNFEIFTANEGISEQATRLIGHINSIIPVIQDGTLNQFRKSWDTVALHSIEGPKFLFTHSEYSSIRTNLKRENKYLQRKLGGEFCDKQIETRDVMESWTEDNYKQLGKAFLHLNPKLLPLAYSYFHANEQFSQANRDRVLSMVDTQLFKKQLSETYMDFRNMACKEEKYGDIHKAYALMELAHWGNPKGSFIKKKLEEYEAKLRWKILFSKKLRWSKMFWKV